MSLHVHQSVSAHACQPQTWQWQPGAARTCNKLSSSKRISEERKCKVKVKIKLCYILQKKIVFSRCLLASRSRSVFPLAWFITFGDRDRTQWTLKRLSRINLSWFAKNSASVILKDGEVKTGPQNALHCFHENMKRIRRTTQVGDTG